ncbi:unnamed protein product [Vitrella brassicaformis CCMP3155]|uniref:AAR2 splicing factor homolog n=2 Tax=Vitrella brassicaformis TaxID=1169539 RepID=A0A0G4GTK3_VITBC|nr:unnamed protein product [Vitrella brassicaformis CCMP3155]|mmetsp:Transcript_1098/g.2436  ORF Transcript_1098/g.2436 Transcript_1098/m.2436 type:complete len:470 (+) Transcript_1098:112-1521(+)|eukprot:CEM34092.1 unnamed protein product [Vitrella brassicaformis CCMP3155]
MMPSRSLPIAPPAGELISEAAASSCTILLLDAPKDIDVGIDYHFWKIGPRFMGIKLIPPGAHYIYWSPPGEEGDTRLGYFLYLKPAQVVVRRWNAEAEVFDVVSEDEETRYGDGVSNLHFEQNLGPYPLELASDWSELSSHITQTIIDKVEPVGHRIASRGKEYDAEDKRRMERATGQESVSLPAPPPAKRRGVSSSAESAPPAVAQEPSEPPQPAAEDAPTESFDSSFRGRVSSGTVFFSDIPKTRIPPGSSPSDVTRLSLDRSSCLEKLLTANYRNDDRGILGELQFAYIAFLLGQNFDGFEQWKALVTLLCNCEDSIRAHPDLYCDFIRVLYAQLKQAPDDLFTDSLLQGNFLTSGLSSLCELCTDASAPPKLRRRVDYLRDLIRSKFKMSLEEIEGLDADAPIVVDLQEEQRAIDRANAEAAARQHQQQQQQQPSVSEADMMNGPDLNSTIGSGLSSAPEDPMET